MKVKAQMLQYEMRKLKGEMRGNKLSTRGFILWFGLPQRRPYIHTVEALTKSIASRQSSIFRVLADYYVIIKKYQQGDELGNLKTLTYGSN